MLTGTGPGKVSVQIFLVLAGFVAAHGAFVRIVESKQAEASGPSAAPRENDVEILFKRYNESLLKRFWRLGLPLIPVQLIGVILWANELTYGPYFSVVAEEKVREAFSVGIPAIWSPVLSGW